jgi:hypothetical protein
MRAHAGASGFLAGETLSTEHRSVKKNDASVTFWDTSVAGSSGTAYFE